MCRGPSTRDAIDGVAACSWPSGAVESGDADGLAAAIRALASDRAKAHAMGQRGRALYERRFAPAIAFAAWEKVLGA